MNYEDNIPWDENMGKRGISMTNDRAHHILLGTENESPRIILQNVHNL